MPAAATAAVMPHTSHTYLKLLIGGLLALVVLCGGVVAYAYAAPLFNLPPLPVSIPFLTTAPYDSAHVLQEAALGFSKIETSSFTTDVSIQSEPRDPGAKPLTLSGSNQRVLQSLANYIPADLNLSFSLGGSGQKVGTTTNADLQFSGALKSSAMSLEAALELRKVGDTFYVLITKLPSLFMDTSAITGKWIAITPQDQKTYTRGTAFSLVASSTGAEQDKARQRLQNLLVLADQYGALTEVGEPEQVSQGGLTLYRYTLALNRDAIVPWYQAGLKAYGNDRTSGFNQATLDALQGSDGEAMLQYLSDNLTLTLSADAQGVPHEMSASLRLVPSDDVVRMKDKQVRLTVDLTLTHINTPVSIDAPQETISLDDAEKLVFGNSIVDARAAGRDAKRVADIKQTQLALELFYNDRGHYPASLLYLVPAYMPAMLIDPADSLSYIYTSAGGSTYSLSANLEKKTAQTTAAGCNGAPGRYCYTVKP